MSLLGQALAKLGLVPKVRNRSFVGNFVGNFVERIARIAGFSTKFSTKDSKMPGPGTDSS